MDRLQKDCCLIPVVRCSRASRALPTRLICVRIVPKTGGKPRQIPYLLGHLLGRVLAVTEHLPFRIALAIASDSFDENLDLKSF